jgi:class 3 adenylate cyclase/tetratricopeptide (TPR) repeat protein
MADISGYTALCASMDAEQVQALLNRFYALTDQTVAAFGGSVIDHAGDGVLAVFGAPVAYGNDPERAVRAALELHSGAAQVLDAFSNPIKLHIGVASGEVVAGVLSGGAKPKYAVTGEAVNLAARLDALAGPGQTLVSAPVYVSVASRVSAEDLGEKALKGFDAPVRVYRIASLRHGTGERLPLVGRQAELRQLAGVLDSMRDSAAGATVVIRGEPGIGKSRLVEELQRRAGAQGYACHLGRVLDFGVGKRQAALPAIVADLLGVSGSAEDSARRAALTHALESGLVAADHEMPVCDLLGLEQREAQRPLFDAMDDAARRQRAAAAFADLARNAARERPRLLVFEDVHWATSLLLSCLAAAAMVTRECPLVLAMTTRFEGDPLDRHWRAASHGMPLLTIDLGPLRPDEARALASGLIEASSRFATDCIERAEGNPLFLEQLLRNAEESGSGSIPPTIQSLVLARMDRLVAGDKLALQAAAVIGKRFSLPALHFLIADPAYTAAALVAADLVRPDASDYLFAHALIQEGVYTSLLNSRKRELHARAADWYRDRELVLTAEHLDRAQDPNAAQAHLAAAQEETRHFRYDNALRLAQRGSALAQTAELRHALAMLRGDLLREAAQTQESSAAFEEALQVAHTDTQRCRAFLGIAAARRVTGEFTQAMQALAHAQPIAERLELWSECSRIHSTRGNLHFAQGTIAECGREHELALECAHRAGDVECEALALSGLGDHYYGSGRMHTALRYFQRCVEVSRQVGLLRVEIPNVCMIGHCLTWTGKGAAGISEVRRSVDVAHRIGLAQLEVRALESVGFALLFDGRYDEAQPWIEKAIAAARHAGARRYLAVDCMLLAACRREQGRLAEARELLAEAHELANQIGFGFLGPGLFAAMAKLTEGRAERKRLLDAAGQLVENCLAHARMFFYRDAIDVALEDGDWGAARRYADAFEAFVLPEPLEFADLVVARARALAALGQHGPQPATLAELESLRGRITGAGFRVLLPGVDTALAAIAPASSSELTHGTSD